MVSHDARVFSSLAELSQAIARRDLSPVDLVEACLDRIARLDAKLHAFVTVYADDARLAADAADRAIRAGHRVGPLHGIPIALKDLIDIEGRITTGGSAVWKDRVSPSTAAVAERLVAAGMIVIGKTHTVEFAMGGWGTNEHMGTPWNPWDADIHRTPGGSSAGSGVAVAAGLAPCAVGTDTGGSVRLPAAWCGIVGLKTTIGRISTRGVLPLAATLDTPGPMTRTVADAARLYLAMRGPDAHDPKTLRPPMDDPLPTLERGVAGLRLARLPAAERDGVDGEALAAYDAALDLLRTLGAEIVDVALPQSFAEMGVLNGRLSGIEGYFAVGHLVDDESLPIDAVVRQRIRLGKGVSARDYLAILQRREAIKCAFAVAFAGVDALLSPTTQSAAVPVASVDHSRSPGHFTRAINFLDGCAVSLPCGFTAAGLPLSLQIACGSYQEATALRIARAYEKATDWGSRRPPAAA